MAVRKDKTRIIFTCSKKQAQWLQESAKRFNMSVSALIRFICRTSSARCLQYLSDDEIKILHGIAKTPWLDVFDEDDD